jgi:predicted transcriptional regulator
MFVEAAVELIKAEPRIAERALAYILAFEQWREAATRAELAQADHSAYVQQLSELQRAMDETWALCMADVRSVRKQMTGTTSGKPPAGMFDAKKKRKGRK